MIPTLIILPFNTKFTLFGTLVGNFFGALLINVGSSVNQLNFDPTKLAFKGLIITYLQMLIQVLTRYSFIAKLTSFWIQLTVIPPMQAKIFSDENFFTKFTCLWSVWASSIDVFHHFSSLNLLFAVNA
jgi:hypothetical protein